MKQILFLSFLFLASFATAQTTADSTAHKPRVYTDAHRQCKATTKAGSRCKGYAVQPSDFCRMHDPNTPRCGAATATGAPCKRTVKTAGQHCKQHTAATN